MKDVAMLDSRIKQMLINDKKNNPNKIISLLRSEIFYVLQNYMDIKIDDVQLDIGIDNNGRYLLNLNVETSRIYITNYLV